MRHAQEMAHLQAWLNAALAHLPGHYDMAVEVIVTTFTAGAQNTLPLWIFGAIRLGQELPEVNVIVLAVLVVTAVPVFLAYRVTQDR